MVSFETEVYNKQEDDIIGIKVMVIADNGQTIESIHCVNETDFNNLKARLDVLNEEYVQFSENSRLQGSTIEEILANAQEIVNINATKLNGFQSDDFSKSNHTHLKKSITDLYDYNISLSGYTGNIGDTFTVTVTVTDTKGAPVNNHSIIIYKNGILWKNANTNSNGIFSASYIAESSGLHTFSVKNQNIQCLIRNKVEWVDLEIKDPDFTNYIFEGTTYPFQYAVVENVVRIRGAVTPKTDVCLDIEKTIGVLPLKYAPSFEVITVQQGNTPTYRLIIRPNGEIRLHTPFVETWLDEGAWVPVDTTFFVG